MEVYYKKNYINIPDDFCKNDIEMQIIEWWAQDEENDEEGDSDSDDLESDNSKSIQLNKDVYTIRCFGVTKTGISITCKITGFKPFYYIKVQNTFDIVQLHHFLNYIE